MTDFLPYFSYGSINQARLVLLRFRVPLVRTVLVTKILAGSITSKFSSHYGVDLGTLSDDPMRS